MTTDQYLIDAATRRQVFLQRYGNGRSKEAVKILTRLRQRINARLSQEPNNFAARRLKDVLQDIDAFSELTFREIRLLIEFDAQEIALSEASFTNSLLIKASALPFILPTEQEIKIAVMGSAMAVSGGVIISDAMNTFAIKKTDQIKQAIIDGAGAGAATFSIMKLVDSIIRTIMSRQINSLISTIINHAAAMGRANVYGKNNNLVGKYRWVSTLDGRTTLLCMSRDQKEYLVGSGPMPPAHYGCRSTTIPDIIAENSSIYRKAKGSEGTEYVPIKKSYGEWLKTQNKEFIDEALGIERSRLFRAGKLGIDKFVDPTGRVYTLSELESMNPIVFSDL